MHMNNNNEALVSVIVVAYQSDKFILEVLDSVKMQTWKNIELIVTDDASKDKTVDKCIKWINDNRSRFYDIKLITAANNGGILTNCDRGLRNATGEWVKFIGADDILLENCIEDNMSVVNNNPEVSFVISDLIEIDENGNILKVSPNNRGLNYFMMNQSCKKKKLKAYARWPAFLNTPTFFYKRGLINDMLRPELGLRIYEDITAIFSIIDKGAVIYYLKIATVKYRIHNKATSRDSSLYNKREKEEYLIYKTYRKQYLSFCNLIDISVFIENWMRFKFKGINGHKGLSLFQKLSFFHWHLRLKDIEQKKLNNA